MEKDDAKTNLATVPTWQPGVVPNLAGSVT